MQANLTRITGFVNDDVPATILAGWVARYNPSQNAPRFVFSPPAVTVTSNAGWLRFLRNLASLPSPEVAGDLTNVCIDLSTRDARLFELWLVASPDSYQMSRLQKVKFEAVETAPGRLRLTGSFRNAGLPNRSQVWLCIETRAAAVDLAVHEVTLPAALTPKPAPAPVVSVPPQPLPATPAPVARAPAAAITRPPPLPTPAPPLPNGAARAPVAGLPAPLAAAAPTNSVASGASAPVLSTLDHLRPAPPRGRPTPPPLPPQPTASAPAPAAKPASAPPKTAPPTLDELHAEFDRNFRRDELGSLLNYARLARTNELPDTFVGIVKYLVTQSKRMTLPQLDELIALTSNAIRVTRDQGLIDLITRFNPAILHELKMPRDLMGMSIPLSDTFQDPDDIEAIQGDPEAILQYFKKDKERYRKVMANPRVGHLLAANMCRQRSSDLYRSHLNHALQATGSQIAAIDLSAANVLATVAFEPVPRSTSTQKVSVIMSAFNAAETIDYAIGSVLAQTHQNLEILLCDDQSTDDTLRRAGALAAKDSRVKVFRSRGNQGTYNIRNNLLAQATGDFITFQDSDDVALPTRIERQLAAFDDPQVMSVFTHWIRVQPDGHVVFFFDGGALRFCVVSAMCRREVFQRVTRFRPSLVAADTEFYSQLKELFGPVGVRILDYPGILGLWGEGSLTRMKGVEAVSSGYVSAVRRSYAEIASRQRMLGRDVVPDAEVERTLASVGLLRFDAGVERI